MATQRIDITSSTIWRAFMVAVILGFIYLIRDFLLLLFGAIIFSAAIEPAVNYLSKFKLPRSIATALMFILVGGLVALVVTLMIPPFTEQSRQLVEALPHIIEKVEEQILLVPEGSRDGIVSSLKDGVNRFGNQLAGAGVNAVYKTGSVVSNIFSLFFLLVITYYLTVEKDALKKVVRMISSKKHLPYLESRIDKMKKAVGMWVLGQLSLAVIMGVLSGVGLWILGVRYALVLGIIAGILEIVPVLGPIISGAVAVTLSITQSLGLGIAVLIFYVVIQQLESGFLIPNVMKKTTGLHPLVVIIAVLLGARLIGIVGVILAVPTATIVVMLLKDIVGPQKTHR